MVQIEGVLYFYAIYHPRVAVFFIFKSQERGKVPTGSQKVRQDGRRGRPLARAAPLEARGAPPSKAPRRGLFFADLAPENPRNGARKPVSAFRDSP